MLKAAGHASACLAAALLLAAPEAVTAQSFVLPEGCSSATGDEGFDPVVIVSQGSGEKKFTNFGLQKFVNPVSWGIWFVPYTPDTYNIITTYTPFLTSDRLLQLGTRLPSLMVPIPAPGVSWGRETAVYPTWTVRFMDKSGKNPVPLAFVDFIPDFVGSSPLTIQADADGYITLNCVQQNFQGYSITVYDKDHNYLYDGSFKADNSTLTAEAGASNGAGSFASEAHPYPDEPE